jgi:catechol 2,3-dioxygenase-like lactoylglutathione lyase family enzyme
MPIIDALDHIVLVCPDIDEGVSAYTRLLGRKPDWQASSNGAASALFTVHNTALELMAPDGGGLAAQRLREILSENGPGLTSLVFRTADIEAAHHTLTRRGLIPAVITEGASSDLASGAVRRWKRTRCAETETAGIKTFIVEPENPLEPAQASPGSAHALDHIVIDTPNPDRALGLYGARLGLDLRLDRKAEQWSTRFLFFRTGNLTFEVIHRLGENHDPQASDRIWGLTWAVEDLPAAHARLTESRLDISPIRKGRKPGSSVFTVKNGSLGVPTLFIAHAPD